MIRPGKKLSVGFLYDDTLDSSDGVAQYVKTLGTWLSARGHQVSYLVGETKIDQWSGGRVYSLSKNLQVLWGGNRLSMPLLPKLKLIKQALKNNNFDVIHVQVPYSPFMAQPLINRTDAKTAVIGTFHVLPANKVAIIGSRLLRLLYMDSLSRFDQMLSVSEPAASFAKETFGVESEVVPNIVELDRFRKAFKARPARSPKQIVFLGRLVERKGCMHLLEAFKRLQLAVPDVRLIIAGDGPQRHKLERYVKQNKLSKSVKFLGFIDEVDKPGILSKADIACFPSLYGESFGIVLIEAMAAGAGVVMGGNNPGYSSVLAGREEVLVDPQQANLFAEKLQKIIEDKQLAVELHVWQRQLVQKYDVEVVGPKIVDIYRRAIAKRNKSSHN